MKNYISEDKSIKLFNADCLYIMDKMIEKDIKVDCIITDPPYLHNKGGNGGGNTKIANSRMYSKDSFMMDKMSNFTPEYLTVFLNKSKKNIKQNEHILLL